MTNVFSTQEQLEKISRTLIGYLRLPFSGDSIPGALLEDVIGNVRGGTVLNTYDFVDVVNVNDSVGWQVKSTKSSTPVTWKRAKIPNSLELIKAAKRSSSGMKKLGNAIIEFCNDHALESLNTYDLKEIGYARLIVHPTGDLTYFERILCTKKNPKIFSINDFRWNWSTPKKTQKKEQLQALHGIHKPTNTKWFAWHGLGENQLHFNGEEAWWPPNSKNSINFSFPKERFSQKEFMELLDQISTAS